MGQQWEEKGRGGKNVEGDAEKGRDMVGGLVGAGWSGGRLRLA